MPLISRSVPNLINGVSQQPANLRLVTQCEAQENAYPSVVDGLIKRYPTEHVAKLISGDAAAVGKAFVHYINRDADERYAVVLRDQDIKVFNLTTGAAETVTASGTAYLDTDNADTAFRAVTIADVTFLVNTETETAMNATSLTESALPMALIFVRQGAYLSDYTIRIDGTEVTYATTDGVGTGEEEEAQTDYIADKLFEQLTTSLGPQLTVTGISVGAIEDQFTIPTASGTPFNVGDPVIINSTAAFPRYRAIPGSNISPQIDMVDYTPYFVAEHITSGADEKYKLSVVPGGTPLDIAYAGTGVITLRTTGIGDATNFPDFSFTIESSLIRVYRTDNTDFDISATDSAANSLISVYKDSVQTFTELPADAPDGYIIEVENSPDEGLDNYWVQFESKDDIAIGPGVWKEVAAPGIEIKYDYTTTPHILIRRADGTFLFKAADGFLSAASASATEVNVSDNEFTSVAHRLQNGDAVSVSTSDTLPTGISADSTYYIVNKSVNTFRVSLYKGGADTVIVDTGTGTQTFTEVGTIASFKWADRTVGDTVTNPNPSFVGTTVNDIGFFKNRLFFLADDNIVLSEAGEFFNFFRVSVSNLFDSAPIDVAVAFDQVSLLKHAAILQEKLVLFSDQHQFVLQGGDSLTPSTVTIAEASNYEGQITAKPTSSGGKLFFGFDRGKFSGLWEFFLDENLLTFTALDVSSHAPKYISGEIRELAAKTHEGLVVILTKTDASTLYIYKHLDQERRRVQSAWSKFTFGSDASIQSIEFVDTTLYITVQRDEGLFIEKLTIEPGRTDDDSSYVTPLDRRIDETQCASATYDSAADTTTFTLPYEVAPGATMQIVTRATPSDTGGDTVAIKTQAAGSTAVVVNGDHSSSDVWLGEKYTMLYEFSEQHFRKQTLGGSQTIVSAGRHQLRNCDLNYDTTGYFKVEVTPTFSDAYEYVFTGMLLGSGNNILGSISIESGSFRFPVYAQNTEVTIKVTNDSAYPSALLSAEFEALLHNRARTVTG